MNFNKELESKALETVALLFTLVEPQVLQKQL
jgi:hypothetical protein